MRGWRVVPNLNVWYFHPSPLQAPARWRKAGVCYHIRHPDLQGSHLPWSCPWLMLRLKEKGIGNKGVRLIACSENGSCLGSQHVIATNLFTCPLRSTWALLSFICPSGCLGKAAHPTVLWFNGAVADSGFHRAHLAPGMVRSVRVSCLSLARSRWRLQGMGPTLTTL